MSGSRGQSSNQALRMPSELEVSGEELGPTLRRWKKPKGLKRPQVKRGKREKLLANGQESDSRKEAQGNLDMVRLSPTRGGRKRVQKPAKGNVPKKRSRKVGS